MPIEAHVLRLYTLTFNEILFFWVKGNCVLRMCRNISGRTHWAVTSDWIHWYLWDVQMLVQICWCHCAVRCVGGLSFNNDPKHVSLSVCLYMKVWLCVFVHMCLHAWPHMWLEQMPTLVALSVCPMQTFCECVPSSSQLKHRWSDSETARETPAKVRPCHYNTYMHMVTILEAHTHQHTFLNKLCRPKKLRNLWKMEIKVPSDQNSKKFNLHLRRRTRRRSFFGIDVYKIALKNWCSLVYIVYIPPLPFHWKQGHTMNTDFLTCGGD